VASLTNLLQLSDGSFEQAFEYLANFRNKYASAESIDSAELPAEFDMRNVMGHDFTSKIRDQGSCASCYSVSFV